LPSKGFVPGLPNCGVDGVGDDRDRPVAHQRALLGTVGQPAARGDEAHGALRLLELAG